MIVVYSTRVREVRKEVERVTPCVPLGKSDSVRCGAFAVQCVEVRCEVSVTIDFRWRVFQRSPRGEHHDDHDYDYDAPRNVAQHFLQKGKADLDPAQRSTGSDPAQRCAALARPTSQIKRSVRRVPSVAVMFVVYRVV